jgi:GAF domain-containing protein
MRGEGLAMIRSRPTNSRLIGEPLFEEITKGLLLQNYYALIGPRKMGKGLILDRVRKRLAPKEERGDICISVLHSPEFDTFTATDLLKTIAESLKVDVSGQNFSGGRLGEKIVELINLHIKKYPGKVVFMINDILEFPAHLAREFLAAFRVCSEDKLYENRVSAVVTGSADFIAMVFAPTSPYRFAKQLSIEGLDKPFAREFFTGKLIAKDIEDKAFDYLYKITNGSMFLLQEIASSQVRKLLYEENPSQLLGLRTLHETKEVVNNYLRNLMNQSITIRMMLRDIESREDFFDKFVEILYSRPGTIELRSDISPDFFGVVKIGGSPAPPSQFSPTPFLVGCGAVIRDGSYRAYVSSPLLRRLLKRKFSRCLIADIYGEQHRWEKAWKTFSECKFDEKYRPISGESRFRLNKILVDWENSMHLKALEGVKPLVEHFINGVRHLLVFDHWGIWNVSGRRPQPLFKNGTARGINAAKVENYWKKLEGRCSQNACIYLGDDQLEVIAAVPVQPPAIPHILIITQRTHEDCEIDTSFFNIIKKAFLGFCTALVNALNRDYEIYLRKVRGAHLKTLDRVHLAMAKIPFNLNEVLEEACRSLVDEGYDRILICLVDPSRTKIAGTNERCKSGELLLKENTSYLLSEPERDVQPWIVYNRVSYVLNDATKDPKVNRELAKKADMKGAGIVPMMVEDKVIGTLHFERGDKAPPGDEEMGLFDQFANQLAAAIIQGQRLAMMQDALHAIDNPIILHDIRGNVLFLNEKAANITERVPGWQTAAENLDQYFKPETEGEDRHMQEYFEKRFEQVVSKDKILRQYWAPYNKYGVSATTWLGSPLRDDWGEIIGTVERFQDISAMFELLKTIEKSYTKSDARKRGRIFLKLLQKRGYKKAHLFIKKITSSGDEFMESFVAVGFENIELHEKFEKGEITIPLDEEHKTSKLCIEERMPLIIKHDPNVYVEKMAEKTDEIGLPFRWVSKIFAKKQLEKSDGEAWIDVPIFTGEDCVGKISVSHPPDFTPEKWQYLRLFAQSAGLAIDSAIRQREDRDKIEHNVVVARMFSHRLNASIGRCLSICEDIGKKCPDENDRRFYSALLANRFLGMQILIDYLLSGGWQVGRQPFERIVFFEFLKELKRSLEFEIADWKDTGIEGLKRWQCSISIRAKPHDHDIEIKGSKYLLFRAIENIAVNAIEALLKLRKNGCVMISYRLGQNDLEVDISNDGPPISPPGNVEYIQKIIASSGSLQELTRIKPPDSRGDIPGEHHRLGLKISTWIVKDIHKGKIKFIPGEDGLPCFRIKLPIK